MKSIINLLSIVIILTLAGCVSTTFETPSGTKVNRKAFLYPFKTTVTVDPDTGIISFGYNTDGGNDILKTAIEAGVAAGVKAAKAGL